MGPKSRFRSHNGSTSDLITQFEVAQWIFASIPKYIELCNILLKQILYILNAIWARSWARSMESHKEKKECSKVHKGTNDAPLEQHNSEGIMKDNLTSIMLVVCPDHLPVKKCAHKNSSGAWGSMIDRPQHTNKPILHTHEKKHAMYCDKPKPRIMPSTKNHY